MTGIAILGELETLRNPNNFRSNSIAIIEAPLEQPNRKPRSGRIKAKRWRGGGGGIGEGGIVGGGEGGRKKKEEKKKGKRKKEKEKKSTGVISVLSKKLLRAG